MSDVFPTDYEPTEPVEEPTEEIIIEDEPTEPETPTTPPADPVMVVQLTFDRLDGSKPEIYYKQLDSLQASGLSPDQYAKSAAEIVERTLLMLHGALPVLQKIESAS